MNKTIYALLSVFLFFPVLRAETVTALPGLGRPVALQADDKNLYITENSIVYIYSLKDYKLIRKFGKKGQGPGEFQTLPHVHITLDCSTDQLIIGSIRKVSYYTKTGEFLREVKARNLALRLAFINRSGTGARFLGWSQQAEKGINYNTIEVFDQDLNKVKQLYRQKDPYQGPGKGYDLLTKTFTFIAHKGRILVPGRNRDSIDVFANDLSFGFSITLKQKPLKVTEEFKREMITYLKTSPETKNAYPLIKPVRFPSHFPKVKNFYADSDTIYVLTWKREQNKNEFFTYTLEGEFKKRIMVPFRYETDIQEYPAAIKNGKLYQLIEDEKSQEWVLVSNPI